jgi:phosphocarrier protein HPr
LKVNFVSAPLIRDVTIINRKGLHARAAAKVVKLSNQFTCEITFSRNGLDASGRAILDLLMLAASQGKDVTIQCDGADAQDALEALSDLLNRGFDEEDCVCGDENCDTPEEECHG